MEEQEKKEKLKSEILDKIKFESNFISHFSDIEQDLKRSETVKNLAEAYFKLSISE